MLYLLATLALAHFGKFQTFVRDYNKVYSSEREFTTRYNTFVDNLAKIEKDNAAHKAINGEEPFGINVFADLTQEEFSVRLMKNLTYRQPSPEPKYIVKPTGPAAIVDWRTKGAITPVKDQGQCGSCWAHSADEALESFEFLQLGHSLQVLSVQQCTACTYNYNGCNGGWPHDAYVTGVEDRGGIDSDAAYPYNIPTAGNCKFGANGAADAPVAQDNGYKSPARGQLQANLDSNGPLSVCVAAESWNAYTGGVLASCPGSVDHCVQAVGYNNQASPSYWIVRNSWGTGWGIKGYIYLDMTVDGGDICHIQEYMTYPTMSK